MRIMLLCGSPLPASRTLLVTALVAELLRREGAEIELWDLASRPLPSSDPAYHADPTAHPDPAVRELVGSASIADGFVLASPVYHNSYSGVLKNALDHLAIRQFHHKPVGLVAFGGSLTAVGVCDQLRIVVRGLLGVALPTQLVSVSADISSGEAGRPRIDNPELIRRGKRMVAELTKFAGVADRLPERSGT